MIRALTPPWSIMQVGEKKTVHIPAADAYGEHNPEMVLTFRPSRFPTSSRSRRA